MVGVFGVCSVQDALHLLGLNCSTSIQETVDCDPWHGSVFRPPCDNAGPNSVVMTTSGQARCGLKAWRSAAVDVTPAQDMAVVVTFSAGPGFRCNADGHLLHNDTCPTVRVLFDGYPTSVDLVIDDVLAAVGRVGNGSGHVAPTSQDPHVTASCSFAVPAGVSTVSAVSVEWAVPGTAGGGHHGGRITIHDVVLERSVAGAVLGTASHAATRLVASTNETSGRMMCGVPTLTHATLNTRADAPASCDAMRQSVVGDTFVASRVATSTDHVVVDDVAITSQLTPSAVTPNTFRWPLTGVLSAGDRAIAAMRGVVPGSLRPPRTPTGQLMHLTGLRCVSGLSSRASTGGHVPVVPMKLKAAADAAAAIGGLLVSVSFEARAKRGSVLAWQITNNDCGGEAVNCDGDAVVAYGSLADGHLPGSSALCTDATAFCAFSATIAVGDATDDMWLWLQSSLPAALPGGLRFADIDVFAQRVEAMTEAHVAEFHGAVSTEGDGWMPAGAFIVPTVAGGVYLEYDAVIDTGTAEWQLRIENAALALNSGLCTLCSH